MTIDPDKVHAFWAWFTQHKTDFDALTETDEPFWDVALEQLTALDPGLCFALSDPDGGPRDFVITASCDTDLFPVVDQIVAAAPKTPGWQIIPLKPAMGFDFVSDYEDLTLDPRTMWFFPLRNSARPRSLGLRIAIPEFTKKRADQLFDAALQILEEGLGERAAAGNIEHLEVCALPENLKAEGYAKLPELPAYIQWNKANRTPTQGWCGIAEWQSAKNRR